MKYFLNLINLYLLLLTVTSTIYAEDMTFQQINLNLVDRLARIEEGQKSIISELNIRFKAVDEKFKAVDERFESMQREMNQRFESVDKRFESVDKRFESMDKRFESLDKRIDQLTNAMDQMGNYLFILIASIIGLIGYMIWDRKTAFEKALQISQEQMEKLMHAHIHHAHASPINHLFPSEHQEKADQTSLADQQEKINQIITVMTQMSNQSPEIKEMMHAVQLI